MTTDPIAVTDGPIIDVSQSNDGQSTDGFEMTIPEIAARIALLAAAGHHVAVDIHVDDPDRLPDLIDNDCQCSGGRGWLIDQTYGFADIHPDWVAVQRCDLCQRYDSDGAAADAAAAAARPTDERHRLGARWFDAVTPIDHDFHDGALPGDWAIYMPDEKPDDDDDTDDHVGCTLDYHECPCPDCHDERTLARARQYEENETL